MKKNNMTEKTMDVCIQNIALGDSNAFKELYNELSIPIYKFALSVIRSPESAEDIAQETFLRIRASAQYYRPNGKPMAWIYSIARNLAVSEMRRRSKSRDIYDYSELLEDKNSQTKMEEIEEAFDILEVLNLDEKMIVLLHILSDLKHSDIAIAINMPYEQVRWKYAYALKKLRKAYWGRKTS